LVGVANRLRSKNGYNLSQMKGNDAPGERPPKPITIEDLVKDLYQAVQPDPAPPTEPAPKRRRKPPEN
jgi:hypothetical protein